MIDLHIMPDEIEVILQEFAKNTPKMLNVEHTITFDNFGITDDGDGYDLSGVDISTAIQEFVNLLDIEDTSQVLEYTLDLYKKSK